VIPTGGKMKQTELIHRLNHPGRKVRIVIDSDTYNEVDDQFALAYALKSPSAISVEAIYAAPFFNSRVSGPEEGMEKSYEEILKILSLMNVSLEGRVFKGSRSYLPDRQLPVESDAAGDLAARAIAMEDEPLYVVAIGAPTNIASAILMNPEIINKIVIIWLGGQAHHFSYNDEFNLRQDVGSVRVLFDSGVPLIQIPCKGVASHLITTVYELEYYLSGKSAIGDYLTDIVQNYAENAFGWSKVIWDISAVAWLVNPGWFSSSLVHSPVISDELRWSFDRRRHLIRYVDFLDRDSIYADLFRSLAD
jgi:purine nucleosidase